MPETGLPRRLIWGESAGDSVADLLESRSVSRVLIVTDNVIMGLDSFKDFLEVLKSRGFQVSVFSSVPREPPLGIAEEVAGLARDVDAVIAVGGGSVIDAAKAGIVKARNPGFDIRDVAPFSRLGLEDSRPFLVAVPTTAGTGSDASYGIVLSDVVPGVGRVKIAVGSFEVVPYATVLDPRFPMRAPRKVKVSSMVDALSHALESLASTMSSLFSESLALGAAETILVYGRKALESDSLEDWSRIQLAATLAGMAFTASGLGLAHAIAHTLGGLLETPHGATVGVVLPYVVDLYWSRCSECRERYGKLLAVLHGVHGFSGSLREIVEDFYRGMGQPLRFRELDVAREDFLAAVEKGLDEVYHDPDIAYSPVVPDSEELRELLLGMY